MLYPRCCRSRRAGRHRLADGDPTPLVAAAWAALVAVAAALRAQGAEPPAGGDVFRFRDMTAAAGLAEPLRGAFPHAIA